MDALARALSALDGLSIGAALICGGSPRDRTLLEAIAAHTPAGSVRSGIEAALALAEPTSLFDAANALGNGKEVSAQDTVPLCLWIVSRNLGYEDSLWMTVAALGDRDTTCAIVGGMLGDRGAPSAWRAAREPLALVERR